MAPVILRMPALVELTGLSKARIYALIQSGDFSRPFKLHSGTGQSGAVAWVRAEVDDYLNQRIAERDAGYPKFKSPRTAKRARSFPIAAIS